MPNNYDFLDAAASVLTARSSITSGSAHEPYVIVSSMPGIIFTGTPSISGAVTVTSTVSIGNTPSISGTVNIGTIPTSSVSGTVGASIVGQLPGGEAVLGSVATLQGTNPWRTLGSVSGTVGASIIGLPVFRPYALEANRIEGYVSLTSTSVTTLVAAAGASTRNYITDVWVANTGSVATLVTFTSQGGASVLGYTIAPAGSGSNLQGLVTPIRTGENETFGVQAGALTSVLYVTVKGFKA